jgi:integrase
VTFNRQVKYYYLGVRMSEKDFSRIFVGNQLKSRFQELQHYLSKAEAIIDGLMDNFSWLGFERLFFKEDSLEQQHPEVFLCFDRYALQLFEEGRMKTRLGYVSTVIHLRRYHKEKKLFFEDITPDWLKKFHAYLSEERGLNEGAIGIYMRYLKAIFNQEIGAGRIKADVYPFGRNKYRPPATNRVKKALKLEEVSKIFQYEPKTEKECWARDMWLFTYLANGMNVKDLALLKYENIVGDEIRFIRAKTRNSTIENQKTIQIFLQDDLKRIIGKWGKPNVNPGTFIFDILHEDDTSALQVYRDVNQAVRTINTYMKRIGKELELSKPPTCNVARHTYSTVLKRANVPIEMISESLGHTSIRTTEIYLDSFEKESLVQISRLLIPKTVSNPTPEPIEAEKKSPGDSPPYPYTYGS